MSGHVTVPEASLLTLARATLGVSGSADVQRLLVTSVSAPPNLGPTARSVLQDTLARGSVLALARGGGWAESHHGRLWERESPPKLEFTNNVIRLLQWVLKTPLAEHEISPLVIEGTLTPAEELFAVLLLERVKGTACEAGLAKQAALRTSALVVLAHTGTLALAHSLPAKPPVIRLGDHGVYLAGLRDVIAKSWALDESAKREIDRPELLRRVGEAQAAVCQMYLDAIEGSLKTRRLAGFLIDAAGQWLSRPRTANDYTTAMNATAPLRERMEARKNAASLLRAIARLQGWDSKHRAMHFLDDDFAEGQALIKDWNGFGDAGFREAARLTSELEALPT